jgi:hypothetical protein
MSAHSAVLERPTSAIRPEALALTGIQGRRVQRRSDLRAQLRLAFFRPTGRHRTTFIPLDSPFARFD